MQIDFHHGVTYVVARLAGFPHHEADIIAYCAQYVDDATNSGLIQFDNGWSFSRISSAHKMLDYRNFEELANHRVWIPFHFLPGNGGLPASIAPEGELERKLICKPNSYIAQDMVRECIAQQNDPYSLHRLGIAMHVYADTWAHQGFLGITHELNDAIELLDGEGKRNLNLMNRLTSFFIGEALPIGHGTVLSNPDKPFLRWGYINSKGERIMRDNPTDYLEAAQHLCMALQRYRLGNADADVPGLLDSDRQQIAHFFNTLTHSKGYERHAIWLSAIAEGRFSFGPQQVSYVAKGKGSWKHQAIGTEAIEDKKDTIFKYEPDFLKSNWKLFHDALQAHRFYVLHELLPQYNICLG